MISFPLADRTTPNSVRLTDQSSAHNCSVAGALVTTVDGCGPGALAMVGIEAFWEELRL